MGVESKSPRSPILGGGKPNNINISKKKSKKKNELHQRKSHSMNKSKKNCIYTTRDNRDRNISSSPEMKSSK